MHDGGGDGDERERYDPDRAEWVGQLECSYDTRVRSDSLLSRMPSFLAGLVLLLHALFVLFALFGALTTLAWRWAPLLHLPALAWGVAVELTGWTCPLTPLENSLRRAAGEAGSEGGFLEHSLVPILYPNALTPKVQTLLGVGLAVINLLLYAWVIRRMRRRRAS